MIHNLSWIQNINESYPIVDAHLADRTSRAQALNSNAPSDTPQQKQQPQDEPSGLPSTLEALNVTRADLSEAQRSRSDLQNRLDHVTSDLEKLGKRSGYDQRRISALDKERIQLHMRLKDREEELKLKAKLLDVW